MHSIEDGSTAIKPSKFGKGLFAQQFIPKNTIICKITGRSLTFADTTHLGERESHCVQIDIDKYILCEAPFLYSNHSCEPNCAVNHKQELFTLHDIYAGEELLWDYSTSMLERHWTMKCMCGSKNCRHIIHDFDLLPEHLQQYYLQLNIVFPFIKHYLEHKLAIGA